MTNEDVPINLHNFKNQLLSFFHKLSGTDVEGPIDEWRLTKNTSCSFVFIFSIEISFDLTDFRSYLNAKTRSLTIQSVLLSVRS